MTDNYQKKFQEIRTLGSGGFSTVFEVKCFIDGNMYAIKKIPIKNKEKEKAMKEIEILHTLNGNYIVSYIDSWIEDNYYILFKSEYKLDQQSSLFRAENSLLLHIQMELCSMTLDQFIKLMNTTNSNIKEDYCRVCEIFTQLLECVQYLHAHQPPIIHRDLKPENIMLVEKDNGFKVKITDFGLSTYHTYVDQSHTKYIGTTLYKAPEVDTKQYDTKADIYSLGKVMQKLFAFESYLFKNDLEIETKYKNAIKTYSSCLSYFPNQRPDCQKILNDKQMWYYSTEISNYVSMFKTLKCNDHLFKILYDKWPNFSKVNGRLLYSFKKISVFEEIEAKAILLTQDNKPYALRVSDHIDGVMQEPNIIAELLGQKIREIVCGLKHVICLTNEARVYSFGDNQNGQLGVGTSISNNKPTLIEELTDKQVIEIKCGAYHSLALTESGKVYAWGAGWFGQIGIGLHYHEYNPVEIASLFQVKIVSISCGYHHCLALSECNKLYGWGYNEFGQLGIGNNSDQNKPIRIRFDNNINIKKISCGRNHSLVLTSECDIYGFGNNKAGQLGNGSKVNHNRPTKIQLSIKITDIATTIFKSISIGLSIDDKYYVWGICNEETLDTPKQTNFCSLYETLNFYLIDYMFFPTISTDKSFSIENSSVISKFNDYNLFKYFDDKTMRNITALYIIRLKEIKAVCVSDRDVVYSFRLNESIDKISEEPEVVNELSNKKIKRIICGDNYTLFLTENHEIFAFGDNERGQLGIVSTASRYKPTLIQELANKFIIEISCGQYHGLALSESGRAFVWGYGSYGQIGNGLNYDSETPFEISSFSSIKIISISCGRNHCLALSFEGELYGWGENFYGQLGVGNNSHQTKPTLVNNNTDLVISKIICGHSHSLLLSNDHNLFSFGRNNCGQLGIGNVDDKNQMSKLELDVKVVDIYSNWRHNFSAALSQNGKYYIWGECGDDIILTPKETDLTSFDEISLKFSKFRFLTNEIVLQ